MTTTLPWGLSRMTDRLSPASLPYRTVGFDPETQLTNFYDASGAIVDMGKDSTSRNYVTVTTSRDGDGSKNAPSVGDDSNSDSGTD